MQLAILKFYDMSDYIWEQYFKKVICNIHNPYHRIITYYRIIQEQLSACSDKVNVNDKQFGKWQNSNETQQNQSKIVTNWKNMGAGSQQTDDYTRIQMDKYT